MPRMYFGKAPAIKLHRKSGRAFVLLGGKQHYLGTYGSVEAQENYERKVAEWLARDATTTGTPDGPTIAEVASAFMMHAFSYYVSATGKQTGEADNYADALKPVLRLYKGLPAKDFTTDELKAVRIRMVESDLARSTVNARINRVRRVWKWAASEKLVPESTYRTLLTLAPLLKNRPVNKTLRVREAKPVEPVTQDRIDAVIPFLPEPVAAMVKIQTLTGCRVGEIVSMRAGDVHQGRDPWEYVPGSHKNDYRENDQGRVIPLGPKAREVLEPFLERSEGPESYVFDPMSSVKYPWKGKKRARLMKLKRCYNRRSYTQAIARGCDRAFPHPTIKTSTKVGTRNLSAEDRAELLAWRKKNRWSPLQIRHATATLIRERFGLEHAQAVLGHAKASTTEIYAKRLAGLAREFAKSTG